MVEISLARKVSCSGQLVVVAVDANDLRLGEYGEVPCRTTDSTANVLPTPS